MGQGNPNPELHPENLIPIKPGEVRNPNGSSKKQRLTNALIKLIEEKGLEDPFVRVGVAEAMKGDFRFWSYVFDRLDGKVLEKLDLTSDGQSLKPAVFRRVDNARDAAVQLRPPASTNGVCGEHG